MSPAARPHLSPTAQYLAQILERLPANVAASPGSRAFRLAVIEVGECLPVRIVLSRRELAAAFVEVHNASQERVR